MVLQINQLLPTYFEEERKAGSELWGRQLNFTESRLIKVVAPSGSGKTSLVHFLYGMRNDYAGTISWFGKDLNQFNREELATLRRDRVSVVFQDLRLFPELSVLQNIEVKRQLNPFHAPDKIVAMAERLGIADRLHSLCRTCSYGEQQRVAIIRALMQPFDLLLLDEPFSHLDNTNAKLAMNLMLEEAAARKAGILFADLEQVAFFPYQDIFHL